MSLHLQNDGNFTPHIRWMASTSSWKKSTEDGTVDVQIPQAIYDLDYIKTGWAIFAEGEAPEWFMDPSLEDKTPKPQDGRQWKRGFVVTVFSKKYLDGTREFATTATGACYGVEALYDEYKRLVRDNPGLVPVVRHDGAIPTQIGKGHTNVPILTIEKWVPRPDGLRNGAGQKSTTEQSLASTPMTEPSATGSDETEF
jgi:hypothetical protein